MGVALYDMLVGIARGDQQKRAQEAAAKQRDLMNGIQQQRVALEETRVANEQRQRDEDQAYRAQHDTEVFDEMANTRDFSAQNAADAAERQAKRDAALRADRWKMHRETLANQLRVAGMRGQGGANKPVDPWDSVPTGMEGGDPSGDVPFSVQRRVAQSTGGSFMAVGSKNPDGSPARLSLRPLVKPISATTERKERGMMAREALKYKRGIAMSVINATLRGDTTPAAIAKAANDPKFVEAMAILQATATEMERLDAEQEQPGAQPPPDSSPSPSPSPTPVPVPTVPPQAGGLRSMIDKYASSGATDDQIIADLVARGYSDEETHMDMLAAVLEARARSGR